MASYPNRPRKRRTRRFIASLAIAFVLSITLAAAAAEREPAGFEIAYAAWGATFNLPALCARISPEATDHAGIFGPADMQIFYLRSRCYFDVALNTRNPSLCAEVKTIGTPTRDGSGISESACRSQVGRPFGQTGGASGFQLIVFGEGYRDEDVKRIFSDHPDPDETFEFMHHLHESGELAARIDRLPDFTRSDAAVRAAVAAAMPYCASAETSYECRVVSCGLVEDRNDESRCRAAIERDFNRPVP